QDSKILESQTKQETNNISETEKKPEVEYTTQVQNIGWQDPVSNGQSAGTVGQSLRLEAIKVNLNNIDKNKGGINYQTYCQNIGWQGGVSNGDVAGTVGKSLRLEAIRIGLSGDIAKLYNVYYRVQVQNFGWL
ncbi:glycerophosphodiester phosphodiesterase, partial [Lacticaseibacillus paracasei]